MKFKIVRHRSARSVARGMFEEGETMGGTTFSGEDVEFTFDDVVAGLEQEGFWGYSDKKNRAIHIWFDRNRVRRARLINFFTHELFHLFGWPLPKNIGRGSGAEVEREERAANLIGDLAELATKTVDKYKLPR